MVTRTIFQQVQDKPSHVTFNLLNDTRMHRH